jgi:hypothetical protein
MPWPERHSLNGLDERKRKKKAAGSPIEWGRTPIADAREPNAEGQKSENWELGTEK